MKNLISLCLAVAFIALPAKLRADVVKPLADYQATVTAQACYDMNILTVLANVPTNETFTIDGRKYQVVTNATQISASTNVPVIVPDADNAPLAFVTNAVRTINSNSTAFYAVAGGTTNVYIIATSLRTSGVSCTETLAGTGNAWASATTYGGVSEANTAKRTVVLSRAAVTAEVTAGYMYFTPNFTPTKVVVNVRASTGIVKAWVGAVTISNRLVILDNSGATDFANTDVVTIVASD